jgi:hypothetical protein
LRRFVSGETSARSAYDLHVPERHGSPLFAATLTSLIAIAGCRCSRPDPSADPTNVPEVTLEVVDASGQPVAARVHLRDRDGNVWNPTSWPAFHDHFVFPGSTALSLRAGRYTYEIERGPEYTRASGSFEVPVPSGSPGKVSARVRVRLERIVDLAAQRWYAGDVHVHREPEAGELLMRAEGLHMAAFITWGNDGSLGPRRRTVKALERNRFLDATAGEDERMGGALLYFRLASPAALPPLVIQEGKIVHVSRGAPSTGRALRTRAVTGDHETVNRAS